MAGKIRGALGGMKSKFENYILGTGFAAGIILAGSDGGWFPWINWAGIGILALVTYYANIAHRRAPWR